MLIVTIPDEMEKSNINMGNMSSSFTKLRSIDKPIIKNQGKNASAAILTD